MTLKLLLTRDKSNKKEATSIFENFFFTRNTKKNSNDLLESFCERNKSFFEKEYTLKNEDCFHVIYKNPKTKTPDYGFAQKMPFSDEDGDLYRFWRKDDLSIISKTAGFRIKESTRYYRLIDEGDDKKYFIETTVKWSSTNFDGDIPCKSISKEIISKKCGLKPTVKTSNFNDFISEMNRTVENHIKDDKETSCSVELLKNILNSSLKISNELLVSIFENCLKQREYFSSLSKN